MNQLALMDVATPNDIALAEHAAVIRALGKRVVGDVIEIGRRLVDCRERCKAEGHGKWTGWLKAEFDWSQSTAYNYMHAYEFVRDKLPNSGSLSFDLSALNLLAAPHTPAEALDEIVQQADRGKVISLEEVKRTIEEARQQEAAQTEHKLAELRAQYDRREKEIRDEYVDKLVLDEAGLTKLVTKQLKPLQRELEAVQRKLASAQKQLAKKKKGAKARSMPKIDATVSLRSTGIMSSVNRLSVDLLITPKEMIDIETKAARVTGQHVRDRVGKTLAEAVYVVEWLTKFIAVAEESCK